mmetsp:Transcript_40755/g.46910  ORF Transcript_40755/g.46910 Transcript_40755/m.46910 type:complete len:88 (+) Transcript_40755:1668-1931(+)
MEILRLKNHHLKELVYKLKRGVPKEVRHTRGYSSVDSSTNFVDAWRSGMLEYLKKMQKSLNEKAAIWGKTLRDFFQHLHFSARSTTK